MPFIAGSALRAVNRLASENHIHELCRHKVSLDAGAHEKPKGECHLTGRARSFVRPMKFTLELTDSPGHVEVSRAPADEGRP